VVGVLVSIEVAIKGVVIEKMHEVMGLMGANTKKYIFSDKTKTKGLFFAVVCLSFLVANSSVYAASGDLTQPSGTAGCILNAEPGSLGCELEATTFRIMEDVAGIAVSADGDNVYAASEHGNGLATLDRDGSNHGALSQASSANSCQGDSLTATAQASGCTKPDDVLEGMKDVVVSPDGTSVYAASPSGIAAANTSGTTYSAYTGALLWFSRNTSTGELTYQGCWVSGLTPFTGNYRSRGCAYGPSSIKNINSVKVSEDGESVYATGDGLTVLKRNTSTGDLSIPNSSVSTSWCFMRGSSSSTGCTSVSSIGGSSDVVEANGTVYVASKATRSITALAEGSRSNLLTALPDASECVSNDPDGKSGSGLPYSTASSGVSCSSTAVGSTLATDGPLYAPQGLAVNPSGTQLYAVSYVAGSGNEGTLSIYSIESSGALYSRDQGDGSCYTSSPNQTNCDETLTTGLLSLPKKVEVSEIGSDGNYDVYTSSVGRNTLEHFTGTGESGGVTYSNCLEDSLTGPSLCGTAIRGLNDPGEILLSPANSAGHQSNLYVGSAGASSVSTPGLISYYGGVVVLEREEAEEPVPPITTTTTTTTTTIVPTETVPTETVPTTTTTTPGVVPIDPKTVLEQQGFCTDFSTAKASSTVSAWQSVKKSGRKTQTSARLEIEGTSDIPDGRSKFYARFRQKTAIKSNLKGKIKRYGLTKAKSITVFVDGKEVSSLRNKKASSTRFKIDATNLSSGKHELEVQATFSGVKGTKTWTRSFSYGSKCSPTHYTYNQLGSWNKKARMTWGSIFRAGNVPLQDVTFTMTGATSKTKKFSSLYQGNKKIGELRLQKKESGDSDDEWTSPADLKLLDYDSSSGTYTLLEPSSSTPKVTLKLLKAEAVVEITTMPDGYVGARTDIGDRKGDLYKLFYTPSKCNKSVKFGVSATSHPDINTSYSKTRSKKTCSEKR